jgi:hypothetical protein
MHPNLMRSKLFLVGLVLGVAPLVAANIYGYRRMGLHGGGSCDDCSFSFGFPFPLWVEGGFVGMGRVLWGGLLADVSIAAAAGITLGLALAAVMGARRRLR